MASSSRTCPLDRQNVESCLPSPGAPAILHDTSRSMAASRHGAQTSTRSAVENSPQCGPPLRIEEVRFAVDSLLEGDGFEPSVPVAREPVYIAEGELRADRRAAKKIWRGTDGSNPSPSSGESSANH